jgi:hypothetical protein
MAVKYVKDFGFDSGFGFSGSSGKTPVRAYMRGGAGKKSNPTKAPSIAPAMVEKRSQGLGGLAPETKKLAAYDKPHMEGKKGAKVPQYAKGGAVKKKMPSFLKAKMMKKADGGAIRERESIMPTGDLTPLPEEPNYVGPAPRALDMIEVDDMVMTREDFERMKRPMPPTLGSIGGTKRDPMIMKPQSYDPGLANLKRRVAADSGMPPSPLAAAARMAPQDRRSMRADRREMARDIMDRYIAGPRRAMPAPRRAMPVAPRAPMVEPAMIRNPRMPVGGVATFAKGGKVSKGQAKVGKVMGEFKRGELHSGSKQGPLVTNPKQAKVIALSEARKAGAKIPKKAMGGRACG